MGINFNNNSDDSFKPYDKLYDINTCDFTVDTIEELQDISAKDSRVSFGRVAKVLDNGSGYSQSFYWDSSSWQPVSLDFVDFDTSIAQPQQEGRVGWDSDAQTLSIGLANGVTLQVGQEQYIRAKNVSGETIYNGEAVYVVGASGNRIEVSKAIASQDLATKTIAICTEESIGNNQNGFFTTIGIVNELDTLSIGTNPQEGQALYLSATTAGEITNIKPDKPNYCVCVGYMVRVSDSVGQILVKINHNPKIGDLSDVDTTGLLDGDYLYYESATQTFKRIEAGFNAITRWDDISLSSDALRLGASSPDIISVPNTSLTMRAFDGSNTLEELDGIWEIMHNTKLNTLLRPHLHWVPTTANTGDVKWQLEYSIADIGSTINSSTTLTAIDSTEGIAWQHLVFEFPTIDITGKNIGAQIKFRLFRNPSDVEDTYEYDAGILSFGVHYEIDGDGSRTPFTK